MVRVSHNYQIFAISLQVNEGFTQTGNDVMLITASGALRVFYIVVLRKVDSDSDVSQ